jgi:hypothetical protein
LMPYYAETGRSRPLIAWLYGLSQVSPKITIGSTL